MLHGADRIFPKNNLKKGSKANNAPTTQPSSSVTIGGKNERPIQSSSSSFPSVSDVKCLLQVKQVELISPTDEKTKVFALCDPACSHSWISSAAAERLKPKGKSLKLTVCGINTQQTIDTLVTDVTVKPIAENTCENFQVSPYIRENLNIGSDIVDVPHLQETYPYLSVLDPVRYSYSNIEMILGQDVYHAIRPIEYFESESKCAPVAVRLPIGWVLSGPLPSSSSFVSSCFKAIVEPEQDLVEQLRTWYELESYGAIKEVDPRSSADRRAVEILKKTTTHDGQRYQVGMLWANDDLDLPNNYYSALVQLKSLEKRLSMDEELRSKYSKNINDDVEKGYVFRVKNPKYPSQRSRREWYLTHHPVINPNKPGKIRRVLNGAAKFHGTSLNRSLLTGPDLLQRLIHTLICFRQHKYAVSADIEGMFLQVGVPLADQPCLRFLWREDPSSEVMVYQYSRHIFGAKDWPTCANFALQKTAKDNIRKFPDAAQPVLDKFYMDDYLDSLETPHEALSRSKKLVELLKLGGFKLTKFISNTPHLLDEIENNDHLCQPKVILVSDEKASSHVLGLKWDHRKDTLVVSRGTKCDDSNKVTQRLVLSLVAKVFDPIGLVAPFTVTARLLLKDIWRLSGQNWDNTLPIEMMNRFKVWSLDLPKLCNLTIPRSFFSGAFDQLELHVFGDSSQDVFSSIAFHRARVKSEGIGRTEIAFVLGKARVAPMKCLTVPKLELQAALLATRLKVDIIKALTIPLSRVFMWTDSTTVLQWLGSLDKQPIFVANRVSEILESTTVDQWFHVPTADNPADAGTRGMSAENLRTSSWLTGPSFLFTSHFPFQPSTSIRDSLQTKPSLHNSQKDVTEPQMAFAGNTMQPEKIFDFDRYSSFNKLVRITAYLLRILPKHASYRTPDRIICNPDELRVAEAKLQFLMQLESFPVEQKLLFDGKQINKKSRIAPFSPFIGPNALIRSTGRLKRLVEADYDLKHPIILDSRHPAVKLFLLKAHLENHHEGVEFLRAFIQRRFAIIRLRPALRSIKHNCILCRKRSADTVKPMMADLPVERLSYGNPAFSNSGIDYFGPFYVAVKRSTEKRWGFLFTCLTTRALHIEVVNSMDTSSCVMGIERFIARRGTPQVLWSDNGTNFTGAEKELSACFKALNQRAIASKMSQKGIKWHFNPPSSPHHGGSWERMVRSVKRTFYAVLGNRRLTDEVLQTTFCLVEMTLNNRPLISVSNDPSEMDAITPNHFLLGFRPSMLPSLVECDDFDHRKRYVRAQSYADSIWKRWLDEYVPALNRRSKWSKSASDELKTGDLVWLAEHSSPRGHFPLGRIEKLRFGDDGFARSSEIRTKSGNYVRPVVKLIPVFGSPLSGPEDVVNTNKCKRELYAATKVSEYI